MHESVRQDLPVADQPPDRIEVPTTEEQHLMISKAARLLGWTVPQFVLCAALDRAERDLYEHAAVHSDTPPEADARPAEGPIAPFVTLLTALG